MTPAFSPHPLVSTKGKSGVVTSLPRHDLSYLPAPSTIPPPFPKIHVAPQDGEITVEGSNTKAAGEVVPKRMRKADF